MLSVLQHRLLIQPQSAGGGAVLAVFIGFEANIATELASIAPNAAFFATPLIADNLNSFLIGLFSFNGANIGICLELSSFSPCSRRTSAGYGSDYLRRSCCFGLKKSPCHPTSQGRGAHSLLCF